MDMLHKTIKSDFGGVYRAAFENREVEFDRSILPTSIKIFGDEILSSPIKLNAHFGDKIGEWDKQTYIVHSADEQKVHLAFTETCENIIVNADVTLESDGFIKIDMRVMNFWSFSKENAYPRLDGLDIEIPIKNEYATLLHYWPINDSSIFPDHRNISAMDTPNGTTELGFKPYVWLGKENCGLGLACESDKGIELADSKKCMQVIVGDESTTLKFNLLDRMPSVWQNDKDDWVDDLPILIYSIMLEPTPVKTFDMSHLTEWRPYHIMLSDYIEGYDELQDPSVMENLASKGVNWVILHEWWATIQNYGMPSSEAKLKQVIANAHKYNMKVMVYFGYEISSLYPHFNDVIDNVAIKNVKGHTVGGWQRNPMQRDYQACYHSNYSEVMLEQCRKAMDDYGVDGIYTDGTYVPWECANEAHGCGYRDGKGDLHITYPINAVREHCKKLYKLVHERGGLVDTHQSSCCMMMTLAFADSYYDGENIQAYLQENIDHLNPGAFKAEFAGYNMGIPCNFIAYTDYGLSIEQISKVCLRHGVYPRPRTPEALDYLSKAWKALDDFGISDATWHPYWETGESDSYFEKNGNRLYMGELV